VIYTALPIYSSTNIQDQKFLAKLWFAVHCRSTLLQTHKIKSSLLLCDPHSHSTAGLYIYICWLDTSDDLRHYGQFMCRLHTYQFCWYKTHLLQIAGYAEFS